MVVLAFGLWTLFVWGGRLRNLWLDPGGLSEANRWSLVGSLAFTALGFAVLALSRFGPVTARRLAVVALAGLTVVVWAVRAVDIAVGDHSTGFIAVHLVLAAVSIGLAALATRSVRGRGLVAASVPPSESGRAPVG